MIDPAEDLYDVCEHRLLPLVRDESIRDDVALYIDVGEGYHAVNAAIGDLAFAGAAFPADLADYFRGQFANDSVHADFYKLLGEVKIG
ncbi:MAG: hypothetical protein QM658_03190 [Gordonia sp. (in: high G+C Gram-positive bacteria)]